MNKLIGIVIGVLVALGLVVGVVGVVSLSQGRTLLGSYNDLGYSGVIQASTSIPTTVQTTSTSTANQIFASNSSIKYRYMEVVSGTVFVLFDNATSTLSSSTVATTLLQMDAGENYTIGPDNLYTGRVMGVASGTAVMRTIEK